MKDQNNKIDVCHNPLVGFAQGGQININKDEWQTLNDKYTQDELLCWLKDLIIHDYINLPLRELHESDAVESFNNLLNYKCNDLKESKLTTRYSYEFDDIGYGYYIEETNVGNIASDYFQQQNRFVCGSINAPSPVRVWESEKFLNGMLKALWSLKCDCINDNTFRTCLSLRKYVASQFKPSVAKSVYEKFNSQNVLDFSAGWGDRLCGFYACQNTKSYIGIDPNVNTYRDYYRQAAFYNRFISGKQTEFICKPAEEVSLDKECVDTVFTSPPYFNVERYTEDSTQSFKRYKKINDWLEHFLFKAIKMSYDALRKNGFLVINISDVYSGHRVNQICDPMNYYIQSLGMKYQGVIGMKMAKRPNSKTIKDGVFVEPMWIWQK